MRTTRFLVISGLVSILAACGGGQNKTLKEKMLEGDDDPDLIADLTGIDDTTAV